jgi:hypothetical protein
MIAKAQPKKKLPSAPRMAASRENRRNAGFTEICIWVHQKDVGTVKGYANGLLAARDKNNLFTLLTGK